MISGYYSELPASLLNLLSMQILQNIIILMMLHDEANKTIRAKHLLLVKLLESTQTAQITM